MTSMDNYKFKLFKILRCYATVTVDIRYTNSLNCAVLSFTNSKMLTKYGSGAPTS